MDQGATAPDGAVSPWGLVRGDADFRRYWTARIVSLAGDLVTYVVLPVLVYRLSGSTFLTALASALGATAYLSVGLVAGALTDRWDRRRVMIAADVACAVTVLSIPVAGMLGHLVVAHVLAAAALAQLLFVFFDGANFGALPMLVGRDAVPAGNTAVFSASGVVEMAAPPLAGLALAGLAPERLLLIDAASFAFSALLITRIRRPLHDAERDPGVLTMRTLGRDIREGLHFVWQHHGVRTMTAVAAIANASTYGMLALMVPWSDRVLGIGTSGPRFAALFTAWGAGGLLGYAVYGPLLRGRTPERLLALLMPPWVLFALLASIAWVWWWATIWIFLWAAAATATAVNTISYRQMVTPEPLLGRVSTASRMLNWGIGGTVGAFAAGWAATHVGVHPAVVGAALVGALCLPLSQRAGRADNRSGAGLPRG